ncbi:uncharacterized protein EI90DRAFT_3294343 [Cantharellus anzutake]|uniref:uncharacterized protein n=1 Tax=Cantharellus anzutake TaxID=1750568 RepID=UPI001902D3F9|nr:uncharacterized protein EI90DRAFT_3294343 [Cantharellus anzutake]KAF8314157.1 hypothetical protein EI90DRAFT_3294343 [Cantharellus anzutake]
MKKNNAGASLPVDWGRCFSFLCMANGAGFGVQPQGSPQEWGLGQGPDGPPQEQGFKGLAPWGVWGAAPGSPQEWGLGQCPKSSPQEQGFKGLAPCTWGTIITRMLLHGAEPQWGLGQRPRGVRGAAPMPSAGARDR